MSKTWYPVIDYERCEECGVCTNKCSHGVFNPEKAPVPVVIHPEGCVQGCRGCGNLCPSGAIQYVGGIESGAGNSGCCGEDNGSCC